METRINSPATIASYGGHVALASKGTAALLPARSALRQTEREWDQLDDENPFCMTSYASRARALAYGTAVHYSRSATGMQV